LLRDFHAAAAQPGAADRAIGPTHPIAVIRHGDDGRTPRGGLRTPERKLNRYESNGCRHVAAFVVRRIGKCCGPGTDDSTTGLRNKTEFHGARTCHLIDNRPRPVAGIRIRDRRWTPRRSAASVDDGCCEQNEGHHAGGEAANVETHRTPRLTRRSRADPPQWLAATESLVARRQYSTAASHRRFQLLRPLLWHTALRAPRRQQRCWMRWNRLLRSSISNAGDVYRYRGRIHSLSMNPQTGCDAHMPADED